jgi:hypothetical protein
MPTVLVGAEVQGRPNFLVIVCSGIAVMLTPQGSCAHRCIGAQDNLPLSQRASRLPENPFPLTRYRLYAILFPVS